MGMSGQGGDAVDGGNEVAPAAALGGEHFAALGGEAIEAAPALAGLLDPGAANPAALVEAVEERIERGDVEAERALGAGLDEAGDLVAVAGAGVDEREDEQLGAALLELAVGGVDMCHFNRLYKHIL